MSTFGSMVGRDRISHHEDWGPKNKLTQAMLCQIRATPLACAHYLSLVCRQHPFKGPGPQIKLPEGRWMDNFCGDNPLHRMARTTCIFPKVMAMVGTSPL